MADMVSRGKDNRKKSHHGGSTGIETGARILPPVKNEVKHRNCLGPRSVRASEPLRRLVREQR